MALDIARMLDHRWRLVELISRYCPVPTALLERHAEWLDWALLSQNPRLDWCATLLEAQRERWDYTALSREALRAVELERLVEAARAGLLPAAKLTQTIVDRRSFVACLDYLAAEQPECVDAVVKLDDWPPDAAAWLVDAIAGTSVQLRRLSESSSFPWSLEFLAANAEQLDWKFLSRNLGLPWSLELIRAFASRWDWDWLCARPRWGPISEARPWTIAVLDEFADRLCWYSSQDWLVDEVVWTPALFERHRAAIEVAYAAYATDDSREVWIQPEPHYWTYTVNSRCFTAPFVEHLLALDDRPGLPMLRPSLIERHREGQPLDSGSFNNEQHLRDVAGWGWASRGLVELAQLGAAAGLPGDTVVDELPQRIAATLEPAQVEAFLHALEHALGHDRARNFTLEAALASQLEAGEGLEVYADWLEDHGAVTHAELLRAQAEPGRAVGLRAELERGCGLALQPVWQWGFVRKASLDASWRERLASTPFGLLESLRIPADHDPAGTLSPGPRRVGAADWALFATLPRLRRLALTNMKIVSTRGLAALAELTDLDLSDSFAHELVGLAGTPNLRRLCLASGTSFYLDLEPVADLPNLVWLCIVGGLPRDFSSLRRCARLAELDLRKTRVIELEPLAQLERLQVLHLDEDSGVSDAELGRLQRANPRLRVEFGSAGRPFEKPESIDPWFWSPTRARFG